MGSQCHPLYLLSSQEDKYTLNGKNPVCSLQMAFGHYSREEHLGWGNLGDSWGGSSFSWVNYSMTRKQKRREEKKENAFASLCVCAYVLLV